jgi:hypothetical protein
VSLVSRSSSPTCLVIYEAAMLLVIEHFKRIPGQIGIPMAKLHKCAADASSELGSAMTE